MPVLPTMSLDQFERRFAGRLQDQRVPLSAHIELTYRCNFDCVHCYVVQPHGRGELSTDELLDALAQLAELGTLELILSGGEPLVRADFATIYTRAKELGFAITLMSNAALIKEPVLDLLRALPPAKVEVTLYGAAEASYRAVTRRSHMHARVLANVDRLLAAGLRVELKTVALSLNHGELEAIRAEARARGVEGAFRFDAQLTGRIDCKRGPEGYRVEVERLLAADAGTPGRADELRALYLRTRDLPRPRALFRCRAGRNALVIDPYGKVQTCVLYRREGGDLRRQSLRDIWERTIPAIVAQPTTRVTRCHTCDKVAVCNACPGNNTLESGGDPEQPSDYHCEIAHARVERFCADLIRRAPAPHRVLPVHRAQTCQRPWLHAARALPAHRRLPVRTSGRRLPLHA